MSDGSDSLTEPLFYSSQSSSDDSFTSRLENGKQQTQEGRLVTADPTHPKPTEESDTDESRHNAKLFVTFFLFVLSGAATAVLTKLQAVPMYNYPNFLNIFGCILFALLCFLYIIPAVRMGVIPEEQVKASKKPFMIMAVFDTLTATMVTFSSVYLPGPLLVLLPQAAIPISMVLSKVYLRSKYGVWQYIGALVVIVGILVVLEPVFSNRHAPDYVCVAVDEQKDCAVCQNEVTQGGCLSRTAREINSILLVDQIFSHVSAETSNSQVCQWVESTHETSGTATTLVWSGVMILSNVSLSLSSIYKERTLGNREVDPVYLNGWLTNYQTLMSVLLAIPAGLAGSPPVTPQELPKNMWDGFKCFVGRGTVTTGCHPDNCGSAMLLMIVFTIVIFLYNNFMVVLLKLSSANVTFLATTMVVPIGNLAFSLPFMPNPAVLHLSDVMGLLVIMAGILSYRFGSGSHKNVDREEAQQEMSEPLINVD